MNRMSGLIDKKRFLTGISAGLLLSAGAAHTAPLDVAQNPLFLSVNAEPNIMFILDDSGSMHWELMPDDYIYSYYIFPRGNHVYGTSDYTNWVPAFSDTLGYSVAMRSSDVNKIYYNPEITYTPWSRSDGTQYPDSPITGAYRNPEKTSAGSINLTGTVTASAYWDECPGLPANGGCSTTSNQSRTFWPAVYFQYDGSGDIWDVSNYTKVEIKPAVTSYTGGTNRTDCTAAPVCTYNEEIQNFANWFTYYRSRVLLARAGVGFAFAQQGDNLRVGFGAINETNNSVDSVSMDSIVTGVRKFTGGDREDFFENLYEHPIPASGTPLRRALDDAGLYYKRTDSRNPWETTPGDTSDASEELACRQSFTILMSDGYWNGSAASTEDARANVDGNDGPSITNPSGSDYQYTAQDPYQDSHSNVLADVAMYYWNRDLQSGIANKVPVNPLDEAFWQHMVTFTVGLGVTGSLDPETDLPNMGLGSGKTPWPNPTASNPYKIDDMWHAAVNSRGDFFSAANPVEFATALAASLQNISSRTSSAAAVATNSTRISSNTLIYQGRFNSGNWTGQLLAYPINPDGSIGTAEWDASTLLPTATNRNIFTLNDSTNAGAVFEWAGLSDQQKADLGYDAAADTANGNTATEDLTKLKIDYLRGDDSEEGNQGGAFRNRASKLGDLVNSDPLFVQHANYGYHILTGNSGTEGPDYATFRSSSAYLARPPMVYVGVNDGMLHAFNAETNAGSSQAGVEQFAYIPDTVIPKLSALTDPDYIHQFYVDGSPKAGDAYLPTGGTCPLGVAYTGTGYCWKTVLLGALGGGGKSIFALDVTDPDNFSTSNVMWEFTDSELGVTIGQPTIVRLKAASGSNNWYAIFGNGYNSASQKAQLFVVNLATGALVKRIDTEVGDVATPNGLATPIPVDINGDRITDYVYAGDLYGNMWKFDFTGTNTNSWGVAYKSGSTPVPFFQSCTTADCDPGELQPITVRPSVGRHPDGGVMVYWGTGKYFETGDDIVPDDPQVQTVYGVRDQGSAITTSRATLQEQTIEYQITGGTVDYRIVSDTPVSYATQNGWYLDLVPPSPGTAEGERVISSPLLRRDRLIFTSAIPSADACDFGGSGWLMELDPISGSRLTYAVMDVDGDGVFDVHTLDDGTTVPITGKRLDGLGEPGAIITAGDVEYKYISTSSGTINVTIEQGGDSGFGRQSWRQIR